MRSTEDWQDQLRNIVSSRRELLELLGLDESDVGSADGACDDFPLKVPRSFVQRMQYGDPQDPLLLQVLSSGREMLATPGYVRDPVGECGATIPHPGIIHKYQGRVLLLVSGGCAINCRYCFRRHFPYNENRNSREEWGEALEYIHADPGIEEVILSGGDPLMATDNQLQTLVDQIAAIPQVKRLRIHTRLPVVIPERVTGALLAAIVHPRLQTIMVIHCNHAREIHDAVSTTLLEIRRREITVLNQAVLLAGVNDTLEAQLALCKRLFAAGTLPYYLHLLDKVQGAAHFDVPESRARELVSALSARLPGYLVPKLVRETAGAAAKIVVQPQV
ncbi:MAG: EF-P beta-lysylation protein EpmB [Halioglobus sp.]